MFVRIFNENIPMNMQYSLQDLKEISSKGDFIFATIQGYKNNNFLFDLGNGINGLMPFNEYDLKGLKYKYAKSFVGKHIVATIVSIEDSGEVFLSRVNMQKKYKEDVLDKLKPCTLIETKVLSLSSFGAFVDLGIGFVGLLPICDISIARFQYIQDVLSVGQEIKVLYKNKTDKGYVVTHKELLGTWEENVKNFKKGFSYVGKVIDKTDYGLFIELKPNLTGLSDFIANEDFEVGDSVSYIYKSNNAESLKVKVQVVGKAKEDYKIFYDYVDFDENTITWFYTPDKSKKKIFTDFGVDN